VCGAVVIAALLTALPVRSQEPFRILVTNDDGVRARGLLAVASALQSLGEVTIVAPADDQSGRGHSLTLAGPIYADAVQLPNGMMATALTATPATCVKIAVARLMPDRPDLVVSGINPGYNAGMLAYVSGTVGAAREAALLGIPAIAASVDGRGSPDFAVAAEHAVRVAAFVKRQRPAPGVFFNVNVPALAREAIKGVLVTRQSATGFVADYDERTTPAGRRYLWPIPRRPEPPPVEGTDLWATANGYVAITPSRAGEFDGQTFESSGSALEQRAQHSR
jgi:5'-nucleotidase